MGLIIFIILGATVVIAHQLGYINLQLKQPNERLMVIRTVCNDKIESYNALIEKADSTKLTKLADELEKRAGSTDDATCMFMITQANIFSGNREGAQTSFERLNKLGQEGLYASHKLSGLTNTATLKKMVEFLDPSNSQQLEALGTG